MSSVKMTSRERVIAAIEFHSPDGIPFSNALFPGVLWRHGRTLVDLLNEYPDDFGDDTISMPPRPEGDEIFEEFDDKWGCRRRRIRGWSAGEVIHAPAGGLIQRGEVAPDWPLENIRAMYKVFAEFRPRR